MKPKYLVRLDDARPTMHERRWTAVEDILYRYSIKPIVAIVPRNEDTKLQCEAPRDDFWDRARRWQRNGWTIAMHGYDHVMKPTCARQVFPYSPRSEWS